MIERCRERGKYHTHEAVADLWINYFKTEVFPAYQEWISGPLWIRKIRSFILYKYRRLRKIIHGNRYVRGYDINGQRVKKRGLLTRILKKLAKLILKTDEKT